MDTEPIFLTLVEVIEIHKNQVENYGAPSNHELMQPCSQSSKPNIPSFHHSIIPVVSEANQALIVVFLPTQGFDRTWIDL